MIYFVYPRSDFFYPYSALIFGSIIKDAGYDLVLTDKVKEVQKSQPNDVLCLSMIYSMYMDFYDDIIQAFNGRRVIIGGDCSVGYGLKHWEKKWPNKDIQLVHGQGEQAIIPAIRHPQTPELFIPSTSIPLDWLPSPDYSLIDIKEWDLGFEYQSYKLYQDKLKDKYPSYKDWRVPYGLIQMSRGCSNNCSFCTNVLMGNRKYKWYSTERVYQEMILLKEQGVKWLFFTDTDFGANKKRTEEMCQMMIDKKVDLYWDAEGVGQNWTKETLELMKASGCFYIRFGLETASLKVREEFNKQRIDIEKIKKVINTAKTIDLPTHVNLIIGANCETDETIQDTINYLNDCGVDYYSISYLTINVGTPMYADLGFETDIPYHEKPQLDEWRQKIIDGVKTGMWEGNLPENENDVFKC